MVVVCLFALDGMLMCVVFVVMRFLECSFRVLELGVVSHWEGISIIF